MRFNEFRPVACDPNVGTSTITLRWRFRQLYATDLPEQATRLMQIGLFDKLRSLFQKEKRVDISKRFELLREAIAGTMSSFHMARDIEKGRIVGLKLLDTEKTAAFENRFKGIKKPSEGEISLAMRHPRIVETYEYGVSTTGQPYLVMEFLEGSGLNVLIPQRDKCLNGNRLSLLKQMLEAIDAVHRAGYIHRDICPRNFIVSPDGKSAKLIDFGLTLPARKEFMQPGNRTGTPLYMAPEIVRRRQTDQRVDLFSFGVMAFYLVAGEHPWPATDTSGKGALSHDTAPPASLLDLKPKLNKSFVKVIHQCLAPNPNDRPPTAEAIMKGISKTPDEEVG